MFWFTLVFCFDRESNDSTRPRVCLVSHNEQNRKTADGGMMKAFITMMTRKLTATSAVDVIFLDMDGVLLPFGDDDAKQSPTTNQLFPDETLAALSLILTELPTTVLVLSSTWRVRPEFCSEIIESFQLYGKQHGGGPLATMETFYDITNVDTHSERQWEIHDWLTTTQTQVRAWVALDDEELILGKSNERYRTEFEGHVVKTRSNTGLTEADARHAIALLKYQVNQIKGEDR
jgi:hypothetical protein